MLSSDHSPTLPELKLLDDGDFLRAWGGISSLQVGIFFLANVMVCDWLQKLTGILGGICSLFFL